MRFIFLILVFIFFSGCSFEFNDFMAKNFIPKNERSIYYEVSNEINYYKNYGNYAYYKGYYKEAVDSYKKVNIYERREVYASSFLEKLSSNAVLSAQKSYNSAVALVEKNKIKALYYLNKALLNDPKREGIILFKQIKEDEKVEKFLSEKEKNLQKYLNNFNNSTKSIIEFKNDFDRLYSYDSKNSLIKKAKQRLKFKYISLLNQAIEFYSYKEYDSSQEILDSLVKVYPKDKLVNRYLDLIDLNGKLKIAESLLDNKKYNEAVELSQKILKRHPTSRVAKEIISKYKRKKKPIKKVRKKVEKEVKKEPKELIEQNIEDELTKQIEEEEVERTVEDIQIEDELIERGIEAYRNQDFENAKELFMQVIELNPQNSLASTYLKKINQRVETIKSLR